MERLLAFAVLTIGIIYPKQNNAFQLSSEASEKSVSGYAVASMPAIGGFAAAAG